MPSYPITSVTCATANKSPLGSLTPRPTSRVASLHAAPQYLILFKNCPSSDKAEEPSHAPLVITGTQLIATVAAGAVTIATVYRGVAVSIIVGWRSVTSRIDIGSPVVLLSVNGLFSARRVAPLPRPLPAAASQFTVAPTDRPPVSRK